MTQREAIETIADTFAPLYRAIFLADWLEDINWHSERKAFVDSLPKQWQNRWEVLHELHIARHEKSYTDSHRKGLKESGYFSEEAIEAINKINTQDSIVYRHEIVNNVALYDFDRTQELYRGVNYIFGWGLDKSIPWDNNDKTEFFTWLNGIVNKKAPYAY